MVTQATKEKNDTVSLGSPKNGSKDKKITQHTKRRVIGREKGQLKNGKPRKNKANQNPIKLPRTDFNPDAIRDRDVLCVFVQTDDIT